MNQALLAAGFVLAAEVSLPGALLFRLPLASRRGTPRVRHSRERTILLGSC
jgi:hypothetical protein